MKRLVRNVAVVVGFVLAAHVASAQESGAGAGREEVTAFPGGGIIFTESSGTPEFGNYAIGGSFTFNVNRFVGVEGEGGGSFSVVDGVKSVTAWAKSSTIHVTYDASKTSAGAIAKAVTASSGFKRKSRRSSKVSGAGRAECRLPLSKPRRFRIRSP